MKKNQFKNKRILPLLATFALISGPVLVVIGCNSEITRYPAALPNDIQNRILFNFVGVNYNVQANSQFSAAYKAEIDFIKKEVEGIMAKQKFHDIFVKKLSYSSENADKAFAKLKNNLGLNILAADYFSTVNSGQNFDNKVYKSKLIFQTENWHQQGTIKFNYNNPESWYSTIGPNEDPDKTNNPNVIFTVNHLYSPESISDDELAEKIDTQLERVATYADDHFTEELPKLIKNNERWTNPAPQVLLPPSLGTGSIQDYQKKLTRFKWWLRFRYQQYYQATILPQLNQTLFTMAEVFNNILNINNSNPNNPIVNLANTPYANLLQDWGPSTAWKSKYHWVWEYTTDPASTNNMEQNLPELMIPATPNADPTLNPAFFTQLASTDKFLKNTVDPVLGINGYINNTSGKIYDSVITDPKSSNTTTWLKNPDDTGHHWTVNNKSTFAYLAPVYWIDVVKNLNFNYYNESTPGTNPITISESNNWFAAWSNTDNSPTSRSPFSQFIRADNMPTHDANQKEYNNLQEMKWNILWDMIHFLSSQADTNPNKDTAQKNFTEAAKNIYPEFIKKENIYNEDFWQAVKEYY